MQSTLQCLDYNVNKPNPLFEDNAAMIAIGDSDTFIFNILAWLNGFNKGIYYFSQSLLMITQRIR